MGAQKDMGLHQYACAFVAGGLAALVFDYRSFGGSEGEPRQWVSPSRHVEDWQGAVDHVTQHLRQQVDSSRMCLWGTSFAGGHVLVTAARNPDNVVAVVSQVCSCATLCPSVHSMQLAADSPHFSHHPHTAATLKCIPCASNCSCPNSCNPCQQFLLPVLPAGPHLVFNSGNTRHNLATDLDAHAATYMWLGVAAHSTS
jgi:dienelactone hydrolase